jgi:hypothetical protein
MLFPLRMRRFPMLLRAILCWIATFSVLIAIAPRASAADTDGDGVPDELDVCSSMWNPSQSGGDFGALVANFGSAVPPVNCKYDLVPNGAVDGADFGRFVEMFGGIPGPACGNAPGAPCSGFSESIEVVGPISR